ncbi:FAD-binding oxidoreductase [Alphaproteobacteria bacterium]|nr:FAD-binding oxidoreductase [Alphaproteobacteria bacterium]
MPEIQTGETGTVKPLPKHAKVVVIGGGVVGCSILFHLAKFGWKDVVLLERDELTSGSSWHAAGQIHTISSDPNISRLQSYTIDLYKEIEEISGHSVGLHITGGFYAASTKEWYDYLKRERSKARYMGLHQEFISPQELAERHPLIESKHYYAALWDDQDGDLDPSGATYAFAKAARVHGARYFTHTPVTAVQQRTDGSWDVTTPKGQINAEQIVNCGGLWAREVGKMLSGKIDPQIRAFLAAVAGEIRVEGIRCGGFAMQYLDTSPFLNKITAPVAIFTGGDDLVVKPDAAAALKAGLPQAHHWLLADVGHAPYCEDAASFNAAIDAFLDKVSAG